MPATRAANAAAPLRLADPHGRHYLVDHTGAHRIDAEQGTMLFEAPPGVELYFADLTYAPA
jgi:hypothetical protein